MPLKLNRFWWAALVAAWAVDFLFFDKPLGVSFLIWGLLLLAALFLMLRAQKLRAHPLSAVLAGGVVIFSAIPVLRAEPFTRATAVLMTLFMLGLLAATLRNGHWPFFRLWDYLAEAFKLALAAIVRPFDLIRTNELETSEEVARPSGFARFWRGSAPVLRGLLLALPVLAILSALFAAADPIFADRLNAFLAIFKIEKLPEYLLRLFYILILAFLFTGVLLHAVLPRQQSTRPDPEKPLFKPFLGWTESWIILLLVDALFAFFVALQVHYLFGGQSNITSTGYTYAEYARRGFSELVVVAVISLLLYLGLNTIARRDNSNQRKGFTLLSTLLIAQVLVILASALQRLMLYEGAYGFTRLRTYTFVFIPWLALLLLTVIVLELIRRPGRFGLALLIAVSGFTLSLAIINVDGFIARQNIQRAVKGEELDVSYFWQLSTDAVPVLVEHYQQSGITTEISNALGAELACRQALQTDLEPMPWQGASWSASRSQNYLSVITSRLSFPVWKADGTWMVEIEGTTQPCRDYEAYPRYDP